MNITLIFNQTELLSIQNQWEKKSFVILCFFCFSSKFYKKVHYTNSLRELSEHLPIAQASIPEKVKAYDQHLNS